MVAPPETTAVPASTTIAAPASFEVSSVIDGDTLRLSDGRSVRLAQVDAPERGACFGGESTAALQSLAGGKTVTLRKPTDGPSEDRYGRTLAEVYVDGVSLNERLVADGAAGWYEDFADEDADLAGRLSAAEKAAKASTKGLWSACAAPKPAPTTVPPAPAATVAVPTTVAFAAAAPAPAPASSAAGCHSSYEGTCIPPDVSDADCASGTGNGPFYVQEADVRVVGPDVFDLDRDRDGIGCES